MSISSRRRVVGIAWIAVGLLLVWRGLPYAGVRPLPAVAGLEGDRRWLALGLALLLGVAKGLTVLRMSARKIVGRIVGRGERAPGWTVLTPSTVLLVAVMVALGLALRLAPYDPRWKAWLVGVLYPAIGIALILGGGLVMRLPRGAFQSRLIVRGGTRGTVARHTDRSERPEAPE